MCVCVCVFAMLLLLNVSKRFVMGQGSFFPGCVGVSVCQCVGRCWGKCGTKISMEMNSGNWVDRGQ